MLLERNGKTRGCVKGFAVNGLDVNCQDLCSFCFFVAVKTGRLPFEIQVALQKSFILCEVGESLVGARAGGKVSGPLLRKMYSVQGNVGGAAGVILGMAGEAQDLGRGSAGGTVVSSCLKWTLLETRHSGPCEPGQGSQCMGR